MIEVRISGDPPKPEPQYHIHEREEFGNADFSWQRWNGSSKPDWHIEKGTHGTREHELVLVVARVRQKNEWDVWKLPDGLSQIIARLMAWSKYQGQDEIRDLLRKAIGL